MIRNRTEPIYWTTPKKTKKFIGNLTFVEERVKDEYGDDEWELLRIVFVKELPRRDEFIEDYGGYGIQKKEFDEMFDRYPNAWVCIYETDTKNMLISPFTHWIEFADVDTISKISGEQRILVENHMLKINKTRKLI